MSSVQFLGLDLAKARKAFELGIEAHHPAVSMRAKDGP